MERIEVLPRIPARAPDSHKGTYGRILIAAGSPGMAGAAALTARAALRTGSGLVTVALPASISGTVAVCAPEATQVLLGDEEDGGRETGPLLALVPGWRDFDALAIGPGLGTSERARRLVADALERFAGPAVFDADALNVLAAEPSLLRARKPERIWTPHPGELERLTGEKPKGDAARLEAARRARERLGGVVLLKGHRTVVAAEDRYYVNETGNPGMATGGAGDVLTGIIASLLGQGFGAFEAAALGARLHGAAGDLAAAALGEASLIASDIIEHLPAALCAHGGGGP